MNVLSKAGLFFHNCVQQQQGVQQREIKPPVFGEEKDEKQSSGPW
jgi:hypothetical protein